jgi:hypothetical protein
VIGAWRGIYLPHGWIATVKSTQYIGDAVHAIGSAGFNEEILNVGAFDSYGNMPVANYAGLSAWVTTSRSVDSTKRIVIWVSGSESKLVDNPSTYDNIAGWIASAVQQYGLDGVMLDFEPFTRDNPLLPGLLERIRAAAPQAWIDITAPIDRWSDPFITAVASQVNALSPMLYDTTLVSPTAYVDLVASTVVRYSRAAGSAVLVTPSIPAYKANAWHDPTVENIADADQGLQAAVAQNARVDGAAVYWWWQITPDDLAQWSQAIGSG